MTSVKGAQLSWRQALWQVTSNIFEMKIQHRK
jgi:hypothetical protein